MRGGTSKGVFLRLSDLPTNATDQDALILALMGSPDPMQIDGLGGTHSSTSKVVAVGTSERGDSDVDYLFAQVSVDTEHVDYASNCGNLTAAVGPYAIDEGLVSPTEPVTVVRMYNRNTGRRILAHVPVAGGRAASEGSTVIAGVPGAGAPIVTEYLDPLGAVTGSGLPTGRPRELLRSGSGDEVALSIVDATSAVAIADADALGIPPLIAPAEGNLDPGLLDRLEGIRADCSVLLGRADNARSATVRSPAVPRLSLLAAPRDHVLADGTRLPAYSHDLVVRALSMRRFHHSCPLTTLMCVAAAIHIPGTIAHELAPSAGLTVRIAHPRGISEVTVVTGPPGAIRSVSVIRTARRLMAGHAYVPRVAAAGPG